MYALMNYKQQQQQQQHEQSQKRSLTTTHRGKHKLWSMMPKTNSKTLSSKTQAHSHAYLFDDVAVILGVLICISVIIRGAGVYPLQSWLGLRPRGFRSLPPWWWSPPPSMNYNHWMCSVATRFECMNATGGIIYTIRIGVLLYLLHLMRITASNSVIGHRDITANRNKLI